MRILISTLKVLFISLIVFWFIMVFVDYYKGINKKDAVFCIKEKTKEYHDGSVYICTGLGYKLYRYERKSINAVEFGPFFIKERKK